VEKLLDEWLIPVARPELIKQYGLLERGSDLDSVPLLDSDDEPWHLWQSADAQPKTPARAAKIDDSAGLVAAAEEGLGFALAPWTLAARALQKGTIGFAGKEVLPYGAAYYFVCPTAYLATPKVALFREWLLAAASEFPRPPTVRDRGG
jgi:LysR family transcriptional regulator, glycine cleavage system transcriptional activator